MGISDLNKTLNQYDIYHKAPLDCLKGRAVAIDASNWIYINWTIASQKVIYRTNLLTEDPDPDAIRKQWFAIAISSIERYLNSGIYPIFVFDGAAPPDKGPAKDKRAKERQDRLNKYHEMLVACRSVDVLDAGNINMTELRKACSNSYGLDWDEVDLIKGLMTALGFMVIVPNCEAERFCSMMCLEGLVAAVVSADTDNLAYGCPCFIKEVAREASGSVMTYASYQEVLQKMALTPQQFLDLCILHGCDYNARIHRVGPKTAEKLIREYGTIEAISTKHDVTCLRHQRCRELFSYVDTASLNHGEPVTITFIDCASLDPETLLYYSEMFEASRYISSLHQGLSYVKECIIALSSS